VPEVLFSFLRKQKKRGNAGDISTVLDVLSMRTDNCSFGTGTAALVQTAYTEFRLCTLFDCCTEGTQLLVEPSGFTSELDFSMELILLLKKGELRETLPLF
jgi:hypothetical protein